MHIIGYIKFKCAVTAFMCVFDIVSVFVSIAAVGDMCSVYIKLGTRSRTTERQIYFLSLIGFVYVYIFSVPTLAAVIASAAVETVLRIPSVWKRYTSKTC